MILLNFGFKFPTFKFLETLIFSFDGIDTHLVISLRDLDALVC